MKLFTYLFSLFRIFFFSSPVVKSTTKEVTLPMHHLAPHGGQLVELGEHGSGFNLELVLHEHGFLQIYVLDAHVDNFVRISAGSIDIKITDSNGTEKTISCEPVADPITGETIGSTSLFTSKERIRDLIPFKGIIQNIEVMEFSYENIEVNFSGMPAESTDEH